MKGTEAAPAKPYNLACDSAAYRLPRPGSSDLSDPAPSKYDSTVEVLLTPSRYWCATLDQPPQRLGFGPPAWRSRACLDVVAQADITLRITHSQSDGDGQSDRMLALLGGGLDHSSLTQSPRT